MAINKGFRDYYNTLRGKNRKKPNNPFGGGGGGSFGPPPSGGGGGSSFGPTQPNQQTQQQAGPKLSEVKEPTGGQKAAAVTPPSVDTQKQVVNEMAAPAQADKTEGKMATLINPQTGDRERVKVGGSKAQEFFGQGFVLEKPDTRQLVEERMQTLQAPQQETQAPPTTEPTQPGKNEGEVQPGEGLTDEQIAAQREEMIRAGTPPQDVEKPLKSAMDRLVEAMTPTEAEQQLADQLAQFRGNVRSNIAGLEGQGRGLTTDMVRGQQEKTREQAGIQEQTLMDRLAILQSQRQARIGALQAQAQQEQQEQAMQMEQERFGQQTQMQMLQAGYQPVQAGQELPEGAQTVQVGGQTYARMPEEQGPITLKEGEAIVDPNTGEVITRLREQQEPQKLSPGQTIVDPQTGQPIYTAPQERETITVGGNVLERDPNTGAYSIVYQSPEATETGPPKFTEIGGETYAWNSNTQSLQKIEVPDPEARDAVNYTRRLQTLAEGLLEDPALEAATGPLGQYMGSLRDIIDPSAVPEFKRKFDQLVSSLTLENTSQIAGAISERELDILRSAGTSLDLGQTTGQFVDELNRIIDGSLKSQYDAAGITDMTYEDAKSKYGREGVQSMIDEAITAGPPQEISFNQVGGDTNQAASANPLDLGPITGYGSPKWGMGLDIDLQVGDPVPSPVSGTVTYVGERGGFGNQVRVRDEQGNEFWLSHLDSADVQVGQSIGQGEPVGTGGNTGDVLKMDGTPPTPEELRQGVGSHLDLTMVDAQGNIIPPRQVEQILRNANV